MTDEGGAYAWHDVDAADPAVALAVAVPCLLGESPVWHPREQVLYWCDIPGRAVHRFDPARGDLRHWDFDTEPGCCAPMLDGGLLLALRTGLVRFDPASGEHRQLASAPYDPATERFNDGKCDPQGRLWVGTIHELRQPQAALYRYTHGELTREADGITVSNGLAWSPDSRTMYWSDTAAHAIDRFDVDAGDGTLSHRRPFARFAPKVAGAPLGGYGGRPDGAAVDVEGCYWVAMFEGARLLRLSPTGETLRELRLPVRCATMPAFGGADLRTLYITTARNHRPPGELAAQPWAGCVLQLRVDVPGLPANLFAG